MAKFSIGQYYTTADESGFSIHRSDTPGSDCLGKHVGSVKAHKVHPVRSGDECHFVVEIKNEELLGSTRERDLPVDVCYDLGTAMDSAYAHAFDLTSRSMADGDRLSLESASSFKGKECQRGFVRETLKALRRRRQGFGVWEYTLPGLKR